MNGDVHWKDTGDRYLLKLFREYVFHQTLESGEPSLEMRHVFDCLNKLELGSSERILLTSTKGSVVIMTFAEVQKVLQQTLASLCLGEDNNGGAGYPRF